MAYTVYRTVYAGHATELAKQICEKVESDICIVSVGGDGTMNEVINGMTHFEQVCFGIIPSGSGNDFRRGRRVTMTPNGNPFDGLLSICYAHDIPKWLTFYFSLC